MSGLQHPVESGRNGGHVSSRSWWIYRGTGQPLTDIRLGDILPPPPGWRDFDGGPVLPRTGRERRERPAPRRGEPRHAPAGRARHRHDQHRAAAPQASW